MTLDDFFNKVDINKPTGTPGLDNNCITNLAELQMITTGKDTLSKAGMEHSTVQEGVDLVVAKYDGSVEQLLLQNSAVKVDTPERGCFSYWTLHDKEGKLTDVTTLYYNGREWFFFGQEEYTPLYNTHKRALETNGIFTFV